jgi:hypothetical protein
MASMTLSQLYIFLAFGELCKMFAQQPGLQTMSSHEKPLQMKSLPFAMAS